jgi:type IX secretion system PorP/SprF family membrane protein
MMKMKQILVLVGGMLIAQSANAQQEPMYTHYMFNTQAVNPAYAGNRGMTTMTLLHRSQWVGIEGAPMSQTFTLNTPIFRNMLGLGVSLQNDKIGPTNIFTGNIDLAYRLKINKRNRLAFGIKSVFNYYNRNLTELYADQAGDMAIENASRNDMFFDFGLGVLYTNEHFYIGLSTPKSLFYRFSSNDGGNVAAKEIQHFYFTAGGAVDIGANAVWKPSTFVRASYGAPMTLDVSSLFEFNKKFEIGAMWRSNDALGILLGYTFKENLRIGYSFDWSYGNRTFEYNFGSHEVMLRYELFYKGGDDITSPRYF